MVSRVGRKFDEAAMQAKIDFLESKIEGLSDTSILYDADVDMLRSSSQVCVDDNLSPPVGVQGDTTSDAFNFDFIDWDYIGISGYDMDMASSAETSSNGVPALTDSLPLATSMVPQALGNCSKVRVLAQRFDKTTRTGPMQHSSSGKLVKQMASPPGSGDAVGLAKWRLLVKRLQTHSNYVAANVLEDEESSVSEEELKAGTTEREQEVMELAAATKKAADEAAVKEKADDETAATEKAADEATAHAGDFPPR